MKARCGVCSHEVGKHSHLVPHPCKVDGCTCPEYIWAVAA